MSEPQNDGQIAVVFIEVLFAIVVGISATKMTVQPWYNLGSTQARQQHSTHALRWI